MKRALMVIALALLMAGTAQAAPIGLLYGAEYNGGLFSLQLDSSSTATTKVVIYTANLTNFTGDNGQQDYLYGIGFFPSPSNPISGSVSGPNDWYFHLNELSAGGCTGGNVSFVCGDINGTPSRLGVSTQGGVGLGPTYQWIFTINYAAPVGNFTLDGISIKAAFSDIANPTLPQDSKGLMSLTTTQVPEPGTLLLFGVGLVGLAVRLRRRK